MQRSYMKYWAFFVKSFKSQFAYRKAVLFRFIGTILELTISICLWTALLQAGVKNAINLKDMIFFIIINLLAEQLTQANIAVELEPQIRSGSVFVHFVRPVSFKYYCISNVLGKNMYYFLSVAVPAAVLTSVFTHFFYFLHFTSLMLFIISACTGMFLVLELSYIAGLLAFFTQRTWYLNWYLMAGKVIFGGSIVPIWFYPQWLANISCFLPFRYVTFEPVNIALQKASFAPPLVLMLISLVWVVILALLGQFVYHRVEKRITVNGG
jgi:ABC-2 type transport system permease protein